MDDAIVVRVLTVRRRELEKVGAVAEILYEATERAVFQHYVVKLFKRHNVNRLTVYSNRN